MKRKYTKVKYGNGAPLWQKTIIYCFVLFVIGSGMYFTGAFDKFINNQQFAAALSFVSQNAHTGLIVPMSQVAYEPNKNANQFATNNQNNAKGQAVALNSAIPPVLFDISTSPVFTNNNNVIILLYVFVIAVLLYLSYAIYRTYKKIKIRKIKQS